MVLQNHSQPQIHVGSSQEGMRFLPGASPKKQRGFCSTSSAEHACSSASTIPGAHLPQRRFLAAKAMRKGHIPHLQTKLHPPVVSKGGLTVFLPAGNQLHSQPVLARSDTLPRLVLCSHFPVTRENSSGPQLNSHVYPTGLHSWGEKKKSTLKTTHVQGTEMQQRLLNSREPRARQPKCSQPL